jgi:hypothetical protein
MPYPRPWRLASSAMWLATFLSIVVALILIAPIAFASPPDPSWIAGIYDGADGDDVVTLVYETVGAEAAPLGPVLPIARASNVSLALAPDAIHGFPLQQSTRGPPPRFALIGTDVYSSLRRLAHIPHPYRHGSLTLLSEISPDSGSLPFMPTGNKR